MKNETSVRGAFAQLRRIHVLLTFAMLLIAGACNTAAAAQPPVLQRGYDAGVTGATLNETVLTTSNVGASTFGLVFKLPVDDVIYAQPLYVPGVTINGATHNVLYVATMSDTVYAFDADAGGNPLWTVNLASYVGAKPAPMQTFAFSGNRNIVGNLGILGTPVIDLSTSTLYAIACTQEQITASNPNGTLVYRLHSVNITNGTPRSGSGVQIAASAGGSVFDGRYQTQRTSLVLSGSNVVLAFGAVELEYAGGYGGWVMAYDKSSLSQTGVFITVPSGNRGGGVWQSGRPPVVDGQGFVYFFVGNAYGSGYDGVTNFSESVLKLDPAHGLQLVDWFTPSNWASLDANDNDLTSSGPMLVPGTSILAGGGKTGVLYVLNSGNLGKYTSSDSQVIQKLTVGPSELRGGPVYWQRSGAAGGSLLYNWTVGDAGKAFAFNGSTFSSTPSSQTALTNQPFPGGILTLSANGENVGSGVLWATTAAGGDAENNPPVAGILHAFDASNLSHELWNSNMNASRDSFGNLAKFVPPLVANGRVYLGTWSNQVAVYGLLPASSNPPPVLSSVNPGSGSINGGTPVTLAGQNFASGLTVTFGGTAATVTSVSPTSIAATTPPHKQGSVSVTVRNPDGQSSTLSGSYNYKKH